MLHRLFYKKRVSPLEQSPLDRLKRFAAELDALISHQGVIIVNDPHVLSRFRKGARSDYLYTYASELLDHVKATPAFRIKTENTIIFSRTPTSGEHNRIDLCSPKEIIAHCMNQASYVIRDKYANCFGLCALALHLSVDLVKRDGYQHIGVQISHLAQWDHVLIKITHGEHGFFYDPWWQRCPSLEPSNDMLIEEHKFSQRMERLTDNARNQRVQTISHFSSVEHSYNARTKRLEKNNKLINANYGFDYFVICDLYNFSNPPRLISVSTKVEESICVIS